MKSEIRVLLAKPGLDGHDKGIRLVAQALRDAGMEVIYLGMRQSPSAIARVAVDEDVDVVGISILSGAHLSLGSKVVASLREMGAGDIPVVIGGIIPAGDVSALKDAGFSGVFPVGSLFEDIVTSIRGLASERERCLPGGGASGG